MRLRKWRKFILFVFFITLPITVNYFSPVLIIEGGFEGVVSGSVFVWGAMLITSVFIGRAWCSYICPYGGLQMIMEKSLPKKLIKLRWLRYMRYVLGVIWLGVIIVAFCKGGIGKVDPIYNTEKIISTDSVGSVIRYYMICVGILLFPLFLGKRAGCRYLCPMSILNIIGTKIRNLTGIYSLRLNSENSNCTDCGRCNDACPMSLDVQSMVKNNHMENIECIMCGECSDSCKNGCIKYGFKKS